MKAGIHSLSAEQYRAASGISRSDLLFIRQSPLHFRAHMDGLIPEEETPALRLGSITHRSILEPDTMEGAFHVKPEGMNFTTKEGKAWKESRQQGVPIITTGEAESIKGMRSAVWAHPMASRLLKASDFERSAFANDDDLLLKIRMDALPKSGNAIADLKTCQSADLESVETDIWNYLYFYQAAFYLKVANLIGLERSVFILIFVEKTPPYAVACYQIADEALRAGETFVERDLQLLRNCMAENKWPGYGDGVRAASVPGWALKQIEAIS